MDPLNLTALLNGLYQAISGSNQTVCRVTDSMGELLQFILLHTVIPFGTYT